MRYTTAMLLIGLAGLSATAQAALEKKTEQALNALSADIDKCIATTKAIEPAIGDFLGIANQLNDGHKGMDDFGPDEWATVNWATRSKAWRDAKDRMKNVLKAYDKDCPGITESIKAMSKQKGAN